MKEYIKLGAVDVQEQIDDLKFKIETMKPYLDLKLHDEDWHGVADAANDIRGYVSAIEALKAVL